MAQFFGYFSVAIIVIGVMLLYRVTRREALKESPNSDRMHFVVRPPGLYRVTGIVCSSLFGVSLAATCFTLTNDPIFPLLAGIFAPLFAFGLYLVYYSYRWRLIIADDELVLTPLFRQNRTYSIRDISHITLGSARGLRVYVYKEEKKLFSVDSVSTGSAMLISYFIEKGVRVPAKINLSQYGHWF